MGLASTAAEKLKGARVLVVDDEILIALDIGESLAEAGAEILGACMTLAPALEIVHDGGVSAAVLDIRLGRETTEPLAMALSERGIPFLFYSGQVLPYSMRERWPGCVVLTKPAAQGALVAAVKALI
jgi:DNA-binding response OmpR family regulator